MPRSMKTNAVRGVAPKACARCKRATSEKDYRWRPTGACHRWCKLCEDRKRITNSQRNREKREAQSSWAAWRKIMDGEQ